MHLPYCCRPRLRTPNLEITPNYRHHLTERLAYLDYADDITLIEDGINAAQELISVVEKG